MERFRKVIRKAAALAGGAVMLGATITGAMAAGTLADYPAPFVSGGKFVDVALVIGDASTGEDTLALSSISTKLQEVVTSKGTTDGDKTVTGGVSATIPLGKALASTTGNEFEVTLEDDDVSTLLDGTITYRSADYDVSEVVVISAHENNTLKLQTSLTSSDDDYGTDIRLEAERDAMKYYYSFDETINMSAADSTNAVEIDFLGKALKITNIDVSGTKFTANVGDEYYLKVGDSVTVIGKTVTLNNVGSGGSIQVDVDGVIETISAAGTETVNGVEVKNDETFYDANDAAQRSATLIMGDDATDTYKDGDPYVGEDENDPDWVWNVAGLYGSTTTSITNTATGITETGIILGVENDFVKNDDTDDPLAVGQCYDFPNNFISICFDSLSVEDDDYMELIIEKDSSTDLSESNYQGITLTSEPSIYIHVSESEGLILDQSDLSKLNGTAADRKTDKIWIYANGTAGSQETPVFYEDTNGKTQLAGWFNGTGVTRQFAHIDYQDVTGTDMALTIMGNMTKGYNITLAPYDGTDLSDWTDNLTFSWGTSGNKINSLGVTTESEEANEIYYGFNPVRTIGSKDEDHRTKFGIKIIDPKSSSSSDEVRLWIPSDLVTADISITGTKTSSGTTPTSSTSAPTGVTASEITNKEAFNLILVGGPCVNELSADILGVTYPACGAASGITENTAIIEMKANGANQWAMVVAGWEAADTRRAGVVLANYKTFFDTTSGSSVTVKGTGLSVSGITVE